MDDVEAFDHSSEVPVGSGDERERSLLGCHHWSSHSLARQYSLVFSCRLISSFGLITFIYKSCTLTSCEGVPLLGY